MPTKASRSSANDDNLRTSPTQNFSRKHKFTILLSLVHTQTDEPILTATSIHVSNQAWHIE